MSEPTTRKHSSRKLNRYERENARITLYFKFRLGETSYETLPKGARYLSKKPDWVLMWTYNLNELIISMLPK